MSDETQEQLLLEMYAAAQRIGKARWGATSARDTEGHLEHTRTAIDRTAEHFEQEGPQKMHGLYVGESDTVLCHTGTSPNSPTHARILAALWNTFVDDANAILQQQQGSE